jgi:hypothetical protein
MKKGDIVFAIYRNSLVEILNINEEEVEFIVETFEDLYYSVKLDRENFNVLFKVGEL